MLALALAANLSFGGGVYSPQKAILYRCLDRGVAALSELLFLILFPVALLLMLLFPSFSLSSSMFRVAAVLYAVAMNDERRRR